MSKILARKYDVIAMGRKRELLEKLAEESEAPIHITTNLKEALDRSQLAVMATSAP